jgi:hypothetical protein
MHIKKIALALALALSLSHYAWADYAAYDKVVDMSAQ